MDLQKMPKNEDTYTGLLFIKAYNKWHTKIKKELKKLGITHPQFILLTTLVHNSQEQPFMTQSKISKHSGMDVMTVCKIIQRLEKNEYLKRFQNPNDTRANAVQLLPKGEELVANAFPIILKIDEEYFGSLKEKEVILQELLNKLL